MNPTHYLIGSRAATTPGRPSSGCTQASALPAEFRAAASPRSAHAALALGLALVAFPLAAAAADVVLASPGLPPSRLDDQGRLVEDWGAVGIRLSGQGLPSSPAITVKSTTLDQHVPAAEARLEQGPVTCTLTAFRAPVWPGGLDVLTVSLEGTGGRELACTLALDLPPTVRVGAKTVMQGGRPVLVFPGTAQISQETRDWGYHDDAVSLPGWARLEAGGDPAFRNIRAGMGGVPIEYRFKVEPKASFNVVLGFCESHWASSGQRPVVCQVEGAPVEEVDPLARWGQHQPGVVLFGASDANGDGFLDLVARPKAGAPDTNPILNVIWILPPGPAPSLDRVLLGQMNSQAIRYVDVGGERDQSLHSGGRVEYAITVPVQGREELTFLVACPGGSAPLPNQNAWTLERLRRSAAEVWRDWQ